MKKVFDVIIIGTGISGLSNAIYLKEMGMDTLVITKNDEISESNTYYAQGGIIAKKEDDTASSLSKDILNAGCYYNNLSAVKHFSETGPGLVFDFLIDKIGVNFSKDENNKIDYTEEAAHSNRRIVHYEDHTGDKIIEDLIAYAKKIGVSILNSHTAIDLITNNHHSKDCQELYKKREVMGVYVLNNLESTVDTILANYVIIASGGAGNLYQHTTNPASATGDGVSMAYRAGADIINSEFIQFHPTSLFHRDIKRFLISESLRGEGAKLINHKGEEFMQNYSHLKELAPRDVVARAMYEEMSKSGEEYMFLDISHNYKGKVPVEERFSHIFRTCQKGGIDIRTEPIPVVPAAHYFCGGIKVDLNGRTSLKNLYAIGEVSCTGLHGANRLASTSLLEGLVWARNAAEHIKGNFQQMKVSRLNNIPDWDSPEFREEFDPLLIKQDFQAIKLTMWNYAGIIRTKKGLDRAKSDLNYYSHRIMKFYREAKLNKSIIELRNAIITASIIVDSAMHNSKSLGCHFVK
ncbi:MAG: L-aspartate oxidase [Spirochaetes bacterium GWF1_31_7]|nr:MAG: L-aspartate oxidase [Spirochaetes bacterium GWE1_32_154]OHD46151.1 MAG: L-aspartate oxidase [Spirochaetes bacterium GWE2_31_10]OHD49892.1 MAG: L-aspartate oxidase [Spirochaetes bacterium GWF1_31_7]HBD96278.1 L-aspartate oxidase [Spirochaetia bacterium]HBI37734.1 L-aspartate oxidase [Spirochaetia bacterium]